MMKLQLAKVGSFSETVYYDIFMLLFSHYRANKQTRHKNTTSCDISGWRNELELEVENIYDCRLL